MDHATLSNYEQAWLDSIAANLGSSYKMQWGMEKQEIIWLIRKQKPKHYICILKEIKFHTITLVRFCWIMQTLGFTFFWPSIIKILLHIKFSRLKNTSTPTVQTNHKNEVDISPQEERIYLFEYIILKKKKHYKGQTTISPGSTPISERKVFVFLQSLEKRKRKNAPQQTKP